jgi:hypothetical protein
VDGRLEATEEGIVDVARLIGDENHEAGVAFYPLKQVRDLLVRILVVRITHVGPLPEEGVRLVEEEDLVLVLGPVEEAARFFSVSPTYFETTRERSIRNTGRPVTFPISVAVSVLPVPGGPWKSAR